jgi:hypothetical protein
MKQKIESLQKPTLLLGKTFALLVSLHFSILLVGCAPSKKNQSIRWSKQSSKELPESIHQMVQNESFKAGSVFTKGAKESVEIIPQKIAGAKVEGGYLQKVFNDDGELIYIVGSEAAEPTEKLKKSIEALNLSKYEIIQRIKVKNYELQNASVIFNPEVIVDGQGLTQAAYISQDYILKDGIEGQIIYIIPFGERTTFSDINIDIENGTIWISNQLITSNRERPVVWSPFNEKNPSKTIATALFSENRWFITGGTSTY